eukprot:6190251-Pleurochrysis_carterae.AAC.5
MDVGANLDAVSLLLRAVVATRKTARVSASMHPSTGSLVRVQGQSTATERRGAHSGKAQRTYTRVALPRGSAVSQSLANLPKNLVLPTQHCSARACSCFALGAWQLGELQREERAAHFRKSEWAFDPMFRCETLAPQSGRQEIAHLVGRLRARYDLGVLEVQRAVARIVRPNLRRGACAGIGEYVLGLRNDEGRRTGTQI